jgi:cyclophilin family peptidyl-prolyl cis-trans isomerase/tetratricopeptide (TPR) repeat protein
MDSKLSRWCDGLIEAGGLAAIILTPLFFNIHSDRVFEPDKLTLLRSIAILVAAAWLIKFVDQKGWQQRGALRWRDENAIWRMPFILPVALLILVYFLSTFFSVTPSVSWAGSYQRLQGTYTTLSYVIIFGTTISTMRTRAQARRFVTAVIITSIPIAFYGLLQHFDLDPLPWAGNTQDRVAGHMGNAIFIAAYLIMAVPLTLSRIIVSFNNILNDDDLATADVIRSSIYIFTLAIQIITILWSGSRGPLLGIIVGIYAFVLIVLVSLRNAAADKQPFQFSTVVKALLLVYLGPIVPGILINSLLKAIVNTGRLPSFAGAMISFSSFAGSILTLVLTFFVMIAAQRGWRWLWIGWLGLGVYMGGWLILFNLPTDITKPYHDTPLIGNVLETFEEWRELPRIGRLGRVFEDTSGTGKVRVLIWDGVLDLIQPHEPLSFPNGEKDTFNFLRPILGYGPESMYVAYNRFYPPELATVEARNASPDRSHNETFDALVITGWAGLLVWQFLYLSVFYYGFRWLGVLRTTFERNLLIGLWVGVGVVTAVAFAVYREIVYVGVALPFGSIAGLIIYLIYYALFAKTKEEDVVDDPFAGDRMLMVALLAAVLAHYVEIHFGIAIAATRVHFFLYIGVMFIIGYWLPRYENRSAVVDSPEPGPKPTHGKRRRRGVRAPAPVRATSWQGPIWLMALLLGLIIGTMGFQFMNYAQLPDAQIAGIGDLPVSDIVFQSMFIDSSANHRDSPFVFVMIILTWMLGSFLIVSEMVKDGELRFHSDSNQMDANRRHVAIGILGLIAVVGIGGRFFLPNPAVVDSTWLLGRSMLLGWGFIAALAMMFLFLRRGSARLIAGAVALIGLLGSLPVFFAGNLVMGLITAVVNIALLSILWDKNWKNALLPAGLLATVSIISGFTYAYLHAFLLRNSFFFQPTRQLETFAELLSFRVEEASQAAGFLTTYYLFAFALIVLAGSVLAITWPAKTRNSGSPLAYGVLVAAILFVPFLISKTNVQVVQADMIYKRGRFYDNQASNDRSADTWDTAIAIYQEVLDRAPHEDYYFLFLGRAYLERSTIASDPVEQIALFNEAESRLLEAQAINPLNTDHTANLARLNTRRWGTAVDPVEKDERVTVAEQYYQDALALSPQNSVIRNEYARLVYDLKADCDQAIELYKQSIAIDPFYGDTYFGLGDVYSRCAINVAEADQAAYFTEAISYIEQGLEIQPNNPSVWLRSAQLYESLGLIEKAIAAYQEAQRLDNAERLAASWSIDFKLADLYRTVGILEIAQMLGEQALFAAPPESKPPIQMFLSGLSGSESGSSLEANLLAAGYSLEERPLTNLSPADRTNYYSAYPPIIINLEREYEAIITTENGEIRLRLFPKEAPLAVNNFVFLATQGFYDTTTFHRVLENFMAQGGDPTGTGGGSPGYLFATEVDTNLQFDRAGILAMANRGQDTNGSQFFITFDAVEQLNGFYTIFGELISGDDVLNTITPRDPESNPDFEGDLIYQIQIVEIE